MVAGQRRAPGDLAAQQGHPRDRERGVAALVALVAAGPRQRLLHRVAGDHAEGAGHAGLELHVLDPARRLGADEVVVVGLAADHDAEAGDAGEARRSPISASPPTAARRRRGPRRG